MKEMVLIETVMNGWVIRNGGGKSYLCPTEAQLIVRLRVALGIIQSPEGEFAIQKLVKEAK